MVIVGQNGIQSGQPMGVITAMTTKPNGSIITDLQTIQDREDTVLAGPVVRRGESQPPTTCRGRPLRDHAAACAYAGATIPQTRVWQIEPEAEQTAIEADQSYKGTERTRMSMLHVLQVQPYPRVACFTTPTITPHLEVGGPP